MAIDESWSFCEQILPHVSRSFALIIPQCPPPIDRALCVAYLICRLADTVEDDASLKELRRAQLYDALLSSVEDPLDAGRSATFMRLWPSIPEGDYGRLILGTRQVMTAFSSLPESCLPPIRTCVQDMIAGMRLAKVAEVTNGVKFICRDHAELDQYCHYVAGTVGIMSTALFETRFQPFLPSHLWREEGRCLGLGLQMTNIIKDCRVDAQRGVSFIPSQFVTFESGEYRLTHQGRADLIRFTLASLSEGMFYIKAVPPTETGVRTFLLGSLLPAVATLEAAAKDDQFQPKINRDMMQEILAFIVENVPNNDQLTTWFETHQAKTIRLIDAR